MGGGNLNDPAIGPLKYTAGFVFARKHQAVYRAARKSVGDAS